MTGARRVAFEVYGLPVTQGSARAIRHKSTGRAILIHDNTAKLQSWRHLIVSSALSCGSDGPIDGAVAMELEFRLPVPKSRPRYISTSGQRRKWAHPWRKPDLDKLARAVLDALTGVLIMDDGQVVAIRARKVYGDRPGASIVVEEQI